MTLGAEPKKVAILAVLVVVILAGWYWNSTGNSTPAPAPRANASPAPGDPVTGASPTPAPAISRVRNSDQASNGEFRLRVIGSRPEDKLDPASIDPQLHLELLAKVQAIAPMEAGRNLFQFGAVPPPPGPMPTLPKDVQKIPIAHPAAAPPPVVVSKGPPPAPSAPPISLKYYGYKVSRANGKKEAFLLDGEDIILATENETVKRRYKIVRIELTSIVIEDTQAKSTQTLKLQDTPS